jgi:hypothetical protein
MREYDENIRLYTPVLQRIIILVAVIIAVPAVLWTITAFVRTYVAPPRVPTFQRMTAPVQPADGAATPAASNSSTPQVALGDATADQTPANMPPPTAAQAAAQAAAHAALATATQPSPATPPTASAMAAPPIAPSMARPGSQQETADKTDRLAAPAASEQGFAWPNPTTADPKASATVATPAAQEAPAAADAETSADSLPSEPITGRVPLPPRRPSVLAMAQAAIPMPRPRPATAGTAAAGAETDGAFGWLRNIFQPQTPPQDSSQNP